MRLIDADAMIERYESHPNRHSETSLSCITFEGVIDAVIYDLRHEPTVDAVPLEDYKSMEQTVNKLTEAIANAEPVRHGRWEFTDDAMFVNPFGSYKCSECGNTEPHKTKYCSNCGCKMGVDINGTD